jgi:hypothetical protein
MMILHIFIALLVTLATWLIFNFNLRGKQAEVKRRQQASCGVTLLTRGPCLYIDMRSFFKIFS